jgi:valyl-tRNA synthetase
VTWTQLAGEIRQDIPILMVMNLIDPYFDCSLFPVFVVKSPAESLPNVKYQPNETLHIGSIIQIWVQWGYSLVVCSISVSTP